MKRKRLKVKAQLSAVPFEEKPFSMSGTLMKKMKDLKPWNPEDALKKRIEEAMQAK